MNILIPIGLAAGAGLLFTLPGKPGAPGAPGKPWIPTGPPAPDTPTGGATSAPLGGGTETADDGTALLDDTNTSPVSVPADTSGGHVDDSGMGVFSDTPTAPVMVPAAFPAGGGDDGGVSVPAAFAVSGRVGRTTADIHRGPANAPSGLVWSRHAGGWTYAYPGHLYGAPPPPGMPVY
jgi:hypothetical protein